MQRPCTIARGNMSGRFYGNNQSLHLFHAFDRDVVREVL